jgi:hypothetical protein
MYPLEEAVECVGHGFPGGFVAMPEKRSGTKP